MFKRYVLVGVLVFVAVSSWCAGMMMGNDIGIDIGFASFGGDMGEFVGKFEAYEIPSAKSSPALNHMMGTFVNSGLDIGRFLEKYSESADRLEVMDLLGSEEIDFIRWYILGNVSIDEYVARWGQEDREFLKGPWASGRHLKEVFESRVSEYYANSLLVVQNGIPGGAVGNFVWSGRDFFDWVGRVREALGNELLAMYRPYGIDLCY